MVSQPDGITASREPRLVEPTDRLYVPHRKRVSHAYVNTDAGRRELFIYYGVKEVSFDEERLFAFGEQLVQQTSFLAETATSWGPGYAWAEVRALLEALVGEGILQRGDPTEDPRGGGLVPSLLPASVCPVARSWSADECVSLTRELGGRPVELGNLEAILSVYRIAHPAIDLDGRQVGEANVFPRALRLDRETEWRVCQYAGSRFRDEAPMNVTALKAMIKHWKPMMATLLEVRAELRKRLGRAQARDGWTVGDLHLFSGVVLSLPAFQLLRGGGASPQPLIHPVLSSLFRITDGIRMTTHLMLFLSDERTRSPEEPTTATELYAFAERNGLLLSAHGVCAGPRPLIDEFLTTVFSGEPMERAGGPGGIGGTGGIDLAPQVRELLSPSQLPDAVDYALLGLQTWAVSRSVWLAMSRAYRALRALLEASGGEAELCERLRARLRDDWARLETGRIAGDHERDVHLTVYRDTYEQAWRALRSPEGPPTLAERIAPCPAGPMHLAAARQLRGILGARFAGTQLGGAAAIEPLVAILIQYVREEQAILRSTAALQAAINARLGRAHPTRPLTARDLRVSFALYGGSIAEFPYLFDMLERELGIWVECTADVIDVTDRRAPVPTHLTLAVGQQPASDRVPSVHDRGTQTTCSRDRSLT
jgi:hypothetical protein